MNLSLSVRRKLKIYSSTQKVVLLPKMLWEGEEKILMMRKDKKISSAELIEIFLHGLRLVNNLPTKHSNSKFQIVISVSLVQLTDQTFSSNLPRPVL